MSVEPTLSHLLAKNGGFYLERAVILMSETHLALTARGYPHGCATAAVERARGLAESRARPISPEIRDQAFFDILVAELARADQFCEKMVALLHDE